MPCNSDYLDPTHHEREMRRAAKLLVYVTEQTHRPATAWMVSQATDAYGGFKSSNWHDPVVALCQLLKSLTGKDRERIVYNAHDATSRDLADWWEEHKAADRKREAEERQQSKRTLLRKAALSKLKPAEREALDLK